MPPAAPTIRIDKGALAFAGKPVFSDLSAIFDGGAWTCLLGPSGVGKSSLLRMVAGLETPDSETSGRVTDSDGAALEGRVAYMAQQDLLLPWADTISNVTIGARLRGGVSAADRHKALHLIEQVGLAGHEEARPTALSGGMRQRVALARTLFEDQPIVLMDEPFSSLDALTRRRLQADARRLLADKTVLLVTHDPWEALRLADAIHVMAGAPAALSAALHPEGAAPRDEKAPGAIALYGALLDKLGARNGGLAA
ncbi:MAG: ABC transporter ATP-binding protein [Alphaproteobacteria bacterium]|nr:ABC transporter ATP-binding protein [Alphaproteobacteria bacterium]